ncbi:DNA-binding protein [Xanthomonas nasturtii]|uniref:DNA-binding protein n=1 Tax=Xanthomonas TaxID=338 RepID=UPI002B228666|nr:DNA-binding protein [Xanthomonas nasturtii]MEA9558206.1 DNA-binding protein [Xanthomonas nasturtii]
MARTATTHTVDLSPPKNVAQAAARGLKLREQHGRGGTAIGVARARDLSAQKSLSAQTIRRMHAYFARHSVDKQGKGWADAKAPSAGYIAWLLWGGDAGQRWAERVLRQLDAQATTKTATPLKRSTSSTAAGGKKAATKTSAAKKAAFKKAVKKAVAKTAVAKTTASKKAAGKKSNAGSVVKGVARKASKKTASKRTASKRTASKKTAAKKVSTKKADTRNRAAKKRVTARSANTSGTKQAAPWTKPNPVKKSASTSLSPAQKAKAKKRAKAAGRPYPNLVDNMAVASKRSSTKRASKSSTAKKAATKR